MTHEWPTQARTKPQAARSMNKARASTDEDPHEKAMATEEAKNQLQHDLLINPRFADFDRAKQLHTTKQLSKAMFWMAVYLAIGYLCLGIPEKWTIIDSIYFAIVTVTTVGYGDLFPTTDIGKLFCIFWVPVGVAWVCGALINVSAAVLQLQQRLQDKAEKMALSASLQSIDLALKSQTMRQASRASTFVMSAGAVKKQTTAADQVDSTESDQTNLWPSNKLIELQKQRVAFVVSLIRQALGLIFFLFLGAFFFMIIENRGVCDVPPSANNTVPACDSSRHKWTFLDSFYTCTITVTSVGYGDFKPASQYGRLFAIFYIPLGVVILTNAVSSLTVQWTKYMSHKKGEEELHMMLDALKVYGGDGLITESEYLCAKLVAMGKASPELLELILHGFKKWDELDGRLGDGVQTSLIQAHLLEQLSTYKPKAQSDSPPDCNSQPESASSDSTSQNPYSKENYSSALNPATDKVVV